MKQYVFSSHKEYVEAQERIVRKKLSKVIKGKSKACFTKPGVIEAIAKYHQTPINLAICHGVRLGHEIDMFQEAFGDKGKWIGTEIVEELCNDDRIIHHDFSAVKEEWIGKVDFIYSNSFDHSRYPKKTIRTWIDSLTPNGRIYIEWTIWHNKLGKGRNKADCFAANLNEYRDIFEESGEVEDVLMVPGRSKSGFSYIHHIFVIKS